MARPSMREVYETARAVIQDLQAIPALANHRIVIIGGLSLDQNWPNFRPTRDVDFMIETPGAPESVKRELLQQANSAFERRAQYFYRTHPTGVLVHVDITNVDMSPYIPHTAQPIGSIGAALPYLTAIDTLVFKINCCGRRALKATRYRDARDAERLVVRLLGQGPIVLSSEQRTIVDNSLPSLIQYGRRDRNWWATRLL